jgi:hypothetical protein
MSVNHQIADSEVQVLNFFMVPRQRIPVVDYEYAHIHRSLKNVIKRQNVQNYSQEKRHKNAFALSH